jgi:DNA-binding NarL/FixJ family response regulator
VVLPHISAITTFNLMNEITICIVDDSKELRDALEEILASAPGFRCTSSLGSAVEALSRIPGLKPDVVLMDINLGPGDTGIDCVRTLKPQVPSTDFMMCTVYEENEKIFAALNAGATGYILKKASPSRLIDAIRELHEGGAPMSSEIARKVVQVFNHAPPAGVNNGELDTLSIREKEILECLSRGLMYKEIGAELFISPETVRKHAYHIYEKLHVTNRVSAVNKYYGR